MDLHVSLFEFIFGFGNDGDNFLFIFTFFNFVELFKFSFLQLGDEIKGIVELSDIEITTGGIESWVSGGRF